MIDIKVRAEQLAYICEDCGFIKATDTYMAADHTIHCRTCGNEVTLHHTRLDFSKFDDYKEYTPYPTTVISCSVPKEYCPGYCEDCPHKHETSTTTYECTLDDESFPF